MDAKEGEVVLLKKYRMLQKIGSGSFGEIYLCEHMQRKQKYAVKLEKKDKSNGQLQYEIKLYQLFQGIGGIAKIYDYGYEDSKLFMVIDLLGSSLEDLFQSCKKKFSLATILNIGVQIITRLEDIQRKGFLHRDIKANNFVIGRDDREATIYIIDFGLAKKYVESRTGSHIPFREGKSLVGTARYASIASHLGQEQGRKDDFESLGYLLLYFLKGKLPWQGVPLKNKTEKYAEIGRIKRETSVEIMCEPYGENAKVLVRFFEYVRSLSFADEPNYFNMKNMFLEELKTMKCSRMDLDWLNKSHSKKIK